MTAPGLLHLNNVGRTFRVGGPFRRRVLKAVDGVSLTLHKGDVLGIVGESGCGKTTLSRMLLGALPPSEGAILLEGRPIAEWPRRSLARRIQMVFQDPFSSLNPRRAIGPAIMLPLAIHQEADRRGREQRARALLDVVGLPQSSFDKYPNQLSGGQRQRAVIARALVLRPDILVCDEPTSALDVSVQAQILNLLLDLRDEFGLTYVLVSHNLGVVEHMATEVAVMYLGRIVEHDSAHRIFASPRHPYTASLLASILTVQPGGGIPPGRLGSDMPGPADPPPGCHFHPRCPMAAPLCRSTSPFAAHSGVGAVECHLAPVLADVGAATTGEAL